MPENVGVISTSVFYHDLEDVIDRIDVSPEPSDLQSARGNIGDGKRYGIAFDVSSRLGFMGLPEALFSSGLVLQDSQVTDPFLGIGRRQSNNSRGFFRTSFRHDLTDWNLNYGINISHGFNGGSGRTRIDIDDIETETSEPQLSFFVEKRAFNGVTFRFESNNTLDSVRCRERIRYLGATANGIIEEIEDSCYGNGRKFALKIRSTF